MINCFFILSSPIKSKLILNNLIKICSQSNNQSYNFKTNVRFYTIYTIHTKIYYYTHIEIIYLKLIMWTPLSNN